MFLLKIANVFNLLLHISTFNINNKLLTGFPVI